MQTRIITSCAEETHTAGMALAKCLDGDDVVLLSGDLGAGKTVFAKGVAQGLEVEASVTSPTFNILLVYQGRLTLNHFDLYRLDTAEQLLDIDYYETLESGGVSLVEWGDRFPDSAPADRLDVRIVISGDTARDLACSASGERGERLLRCWRGRCLEADLHVDDGGGDS